MVRQKRDAGKHWYTLRMRALPRLPVNVLVFYAGSIVGGGINYLYNIIMARDAFLGPDEFGALAALTSMLYLVSIIVSTLTTTTANYTATFLAQDQVQRVAYFIRHLSWYSGLIGGAVGILVAASSRLISPALHLNTTLPVLIIALSIPVMLLLGITTGVLQGMRAFSTLTVVFVVGATFRLLFALPLVTVIHLGISGALLAGLLASLLVYGISLFSLRQIVHVPAVKPKQTEMSFSWRQLFGYTQQVFWATLGLISLFSIDIILAQHYLAAPSASIYSGLSTLGRVIYFLILPITMVMFPIVTKHFAIQQSIRTIIVVTGLGLAGIAMSIISIYATIPEYIIRLSIGESYLAGTSLLWLFGLFYGLLSFSTWLIYIGLAIRNKLAAYLPLIAVITQGVLILRYHHTIEQILVISLGSAAALTLGLVVTMLMPHGTTTTGQAEGRTWHKMARFRDMEK